MRQFADDPPVESKLAEQLRDADDVLAIAETCTGGVVSSLVTDVPGASTFFDRAFVPYSCDSLRETLGVERELLDEHGVVSAPVTRRLAQRARDLTDATWGLSTTGIAGPSGGSEEAPVGTAYLGVAYAGSWGSGESYSTVERREFDGNRRAIRERIARSAMECLSEEIETA